MIRNLLMLKTVSSFCLLLCFSVCNLFAQAGAAPIVPVNSIVNNASYAPGTNPLAAGSIAAIFGSNLTDGSSCLHAAGCDQTFDSTGHLKTTMAGARVTINGSPVPVFYATPGQLGIQIPFELAGSSAALQVTVNGQTNPTRTFLIGPFAPGIFSNNQQGSGPGAITHADGTTVSSSNPARPGETVIIYATGLGLVTPALPTGTKPTATVETLTSPAVTIDGLPAAVQFSGLSGCCVGLNQINVVVPSNVRVGTDANATLSVGGKQSNTVTIFVAAPPPPPALFTLTLSTAGTGTVTANPTGPTYTAGTVVTLEAIPTNGSTFSGWSGACSGTGSCTVTVNSNTTVTAAFTAPPPPPPINLSGSWLGTYTSSLFSNDRGSIQWIIVQSGTSLSGTISVGNSVCFSNGTMSGSFVGTTLILTGVFPGSPTSLSFSGTFTASSMSGTWATAGGLCGGDAGTWSLTKVN